MITKSRLETMMAATGEFDTATHEDLQEIARLALRGLETQWTPISHAPNHGQILATTDINPPYGEIELLNLPFLAATWKWFIPVSAIGKPEVKS